MFVKDERCCNMEEKGMVLGLELWFVNDEVSLGMAEEEGPICSFSLSMSPPLWHESDRIVRLAPFGTRFTSCLKSKSEHQQSILRIVSTN